MKAIYKAAFPYQTDVLALPVANLADALPFYQKVFGFRSVSQQETPCPSAILARDTIQIGLAENGGDPTQDGCFFEVDDVEAAFDELKANGLSLTEPNYRIDKHGDTTYRVFFVIAPDSLCYCLGEVSSLRVQ